MNIKILDSWLREYVKTDATPQKIAEVMSLTSVSIEKIEKWENDYAYDIEVTTNRPDLMSVTGLAREAAAVLPHFGIPATFEQLHLQRHPDKAAIQDRISSSLQHDNKVKFEIENNPELVNRVSGVVMEVQVKDTPKDIKKRLEASGIRSLNNLIDITNYVMRVIGHPTHVFDYDRLQSQKLRIRESKKGEKIITLDGKTYELPGGDIIAVDEKGRIVDLLGIMGLENSVVTDETKRILFFIDNNDPERMRKTSMTLGIRSEAVQLNEKAIDPHLIEDALYYGISLYEQFADGKIISNIFDHFPNQYKKKVLIVSENLINTVIGIEIPLNQAATIVTSLGFDVKIGKDILDITVPSFRYNDINNEEDIIEEIARIYGYHKIPSALPPLSPSNLAHYTNEFYWEQRIKDAFKYWGFSEVYTYSMVGENLFEGELSEAVTIQNPLTEDMVYMRKTLIPNLLQVIHENKTREEIKIFEIANIYRKQINSLPHEKLHLAGIMKKPNVSFFEVKGLFEQLAEDLGINGLKFKAIDNGSTGAEIYIHSERIGDIEILDAQVIDFEIDFGLLIEHATAKKTYEPLAKYPPIIEDMAFLLPDTVSIGEIIETIKAQNQLIKTVTLLDKYKDTRTFRITYQNPEKNLTSEDVTPVREKIEKVLKEKLQIQLK